MGFVSTRRDQTTHRILDGAASAFAKGGFAGTSMEEIAAASGVSKLLLYRDFTGKRELYQAVLARTQASITELISDAGSIRALYDLLAIARADPDGFTLLFRHAAREPDFAEFATALTDDYVRAAVEHCAGRFDGEGLIRRSAMAAAFERDAFAVGALGVGDDEMVAGFGGL